MIESHLASIVPRACANDVYDRQTLVNAIGVTAASGVALGIIAIIAGIIPMGVALIVMSIGAAGAWLFLYRKSPLGKERAARSAILREAEQQWQRATADLSGQLHKFTTDFDQHLVGLNLARSELLVLEQKKQRYLTDKQRLARERQFADYMDSFNIADADIPGIGSTRVAVLAYHGIETARDVPEVREIMAIQGFGDVLASSLAIWKQFLANQFQFNAARGLPLADIQAITLRFNQDRLRHETNLRQGEAQLRRISAATTAQLKPLSQRVALLKQAVDQARADLRSL